MKGIKPLILAAGESSRMGPGKQKVILNLLGRPLLDYIFEACENVTDLPPGVVVGHRREEVRETFSDRSVDWIHQEEQLGTGHAVQTALQDPGVKEANHLLVLCGDVPGIRGETLQNLCKMHIENEAALTLLTATLDDPTGYGRILRNSDGHIEGIVEDQLASEEEKKIQEINTGAMIIRVDACRDLIHSLKKREKKGEILLTDLVELLRENGTRVYGLSTADRTEIQGVNTPEQKVKVTEQLRTRVLSKLMKEGVEILSPDQTYIEPDVEIGRGTVIEPFVVIRNGVRIGRNCHVGPFCQLRHGTVLEDEAEIGNYVETKNSRIGKKTKAKHLSYIGDAELGENVNIGAGTITANYDGVRKHRTLIKEGASTGSNSVLVAPVTLGKNSRTGAGAVVLQNEDVEDGETVVGVPAESTEEKKRSKSNDAD